MDDNDYKDLDKFFKSRLNQKDTESNGWDVPSDSVLDNVLAQVATPKPKRKIPYALWTMLLLLPLFIASFFVLRSNDKSEIDNLNKQVALLQSELNKSQELNTEGLQSYPETKRNKDHNSSQLTNTKAEDKRTLNTGSFNSTKGRTVSSTKNITDKQNQEFNINYSIVNQEERSSNNLNPNGASKAIRTTAISQDTNLDKSVKVPVALSKITLLKFSIPLLLNTRSPKEPMAKTTAVESLLEVNKWGSYITFGHLYSTFNMTNLPAATYSLTDYDKFYSGWEIGTGISYAISKRNQFKTDIKYSVINNESHFSQTSTYLESDELTNTNGETFYSADLDISSPIGQHTENLLVNVTDQDVADGDATENFADIYQKFNTLSVNTYLTQGLINTEEVKVELYGGVGFNYFTNARQSIKISMQHHDEEMASKSIETNGILSMNRFHLNGQLGLSVGKIFKDKLFIGFNTGIQRSLTSIRKSNPSNESKTYLGSFQSGIKLGYSF